MSNLHQPEDITAYNENSLKALVRAIRFSQGQFRLILARCNYGALRDAIVAQLRELSPVEMRELVLPESVKSLYSAIKDELGDEVPPALMVFGLESVSDIKAVLRSSNYIREEFKESFPFPLVLWINDEVLQKLLRIAPDLESWATSVEFSLTTEELINFLRQKVDQLFTDDAIITLKDCSELEAACKELQSRGQGLDPDLEASLEFVRGLDDFANDRIDAALEHYQNSLAFFGRDQNYLIRQGILLLDIALCYYRKAEKQRSHSRRYWEQSRNYLQRCMSVFALAQRPDLVGQYGSKLAEVLRCLQAWEELKSLIPKIGKLHQRYGKTSQIAQDYGFLAEVALEELRWQEAYQFAQKALQILAKVPESQTHERGLYRFLLACSQQHLEQIPEAIENLEQVREESPSLDKPQLYIDILENLRSLYFEQGEYLKAFEVKQEKRSIEYQYGIQAFAGASHLQPKRQVIHPKLAQTERQAIVAQEIAASGREPFVKRLIERISGNHHKLTVIHGQSGVGKSSIIQAGLVPALKQQAIGERDALPVVLRVYTDWVGMLGKCLGEALREIQIERNRDRGAVRLFASHLAEALREVGKLPSIDSSRPPGLISPPSPLSPEGAPSPPLKRGEPEEEALLTARGELEEVAPCSSQDKPEGSSEVSPPVQVEDGMGLLNLTRQEGSSGASPSFEGGLGGSFFSTDTIIKQLRLNADCNLLTVLIFDQFEEFFFVSKEPAKRRQFYEFLGICLNIPFVKVILSLREDYLHYLLECNRLNHLDAINHNILDKDILCYLGNFSPEEAKIIIESLTNRSQFYLEPALIDELVKDLAVEFDSVRPIELQVVGAQLQENQITTLEKYRGLGENPKAALVKQYLEGVIQDCGRENKRIARLVLYWLTDENLTRPLKTRTELVKDLAAAGLKAKANKLDLVLPILVGSGLVVRVPESPDDRYQLVHDYLVAFIRQHQGAEVEELRKELESQRKRADEFQIGQSDALSRYSEALFNQGKELEALIEGLRAGIPLKQLAYVNGDTEIRVVTSLRQAIDRVQERKRCLEGHTDVVYSVSFSPDGQTLASASWDKTIKLWSSDSKLLHTFYGHKAGIYSVSFSPDGQTIASASWDGTIKLWTCEGEILHTLCGHRAAVNSLSFSPDAQMLASGSKDATIKLWTCEGEILHMLCGHGAAVNSLSFSPDAQMLASGSKDGAIKLWNRQGQLLHTFLGHKTGVNSLSFSPDAQMLASASCNGTIKFWTNEGQLLHTFSGHNDAVNSLSFSPDGRMMASASWDKTVKLWSTEGKLLYTFSGYKAGVSSVSFSPDGKTIASASWKVIKLWRSEDEIFYTFLGHNDTVNSLSFSPDGRMIASASGNTILLRSSEGQLLHTLIGHEATVNCLSFSSDSKTLASGSSNGIIQLWSDQGKVLHTFSGYDATIDHLCFSRDCKTIASASGDGTIKLWSDQGELLHTLIGHEVAVNCLSSSPDDKTIASGSRDKTIKLWSDQGELLHTLIGHEAAVNCLSFSPDGMIIASASWDGAIKLWSDQGELLHTFSGHDTEVNSLSFSPDGQRIASASIDKKIKLWNREGKLLHILRGHKERVSKVSFSPDGKTIISASKNGTVIRWNLDLDDLLVRGCKLVRDYLKTDSNVEQSDRHLCDDILVQK